MNAQWPAESMFDYSSNSALVFERLLIMPGGSCSRPYLRSPIKKSAVCWEQQTYVDPL
jgi:hypothetical protein